MNAKHIETGLYIVLWLEQFSKKAITSKAKPCGTIAAEDSDVLRGGQASLFPGLADLVVKGDGDLSTKISSSCHVTVLLSSDCNASKGMAKAITNTTKKPRTKQA